MLSPLAAALSLIFPNLKPNPNPSRRRRFAIHAAVVVAWNRSGGRWVSLVVLYVYAQGIVVGICKEPAPPEALRRHRRAVPVNRHHPRPPPSSPLSRTRQG